MFMIKNCLKSMVLITDDVNCQLRCTGVLMLSVICAIMWIPFAETCIDRSYLIDI